MADRKVTETEFIGDNTMAGGPAPQVMVTEGNEIPQNGNGLKRKVDQTYWSLVKHQYKKKINWLLRLFMLLFFWLQWL